MRWLTIDIGEATGWSIWEDEELKEAGTTRLWHFIDDVEDGLARKTGPFAGIELLICEDWALYDWKLREMAWDKCRTARGIGALTLLCRQTGTAFKLQGAKIKPLAVAAGAEELFYRPLKENRHQNDAIMHGVYYRHVTLRGNLPPEPPTQEELDAIRPEDHPYAPH